MNNVLITGAGSFVGMSVEKWLMQSPELFSVSTVDTMENKWKGVDYTQFDVVFHVAGIAHVDPKPEMAPLYYAVNRDLAIDVARHAKQNGVRQFIYMSSRIVYKAGRTMKANITDLNTVPEPDDFYGDSKLQAEQGLLQLEDESFKVVILRPCMIYGPGCKGNFPKLVKLARKTPVFPAWHNRRSMLYIDNLSEMVKQIILRQLRGTFFPQNAEYVDTVEIVRYFAKQSGHRVWISRLFNPLVSIGALFLKQVPKMFADSCYVHEMSKYDFDYQVVGTEESFSLLSSYLMKN